MKITTEPLENRQLSVTIEIEEARVQQAMKLAARNIAKEARIPGFRRGKAPFDVIVQRFGESTVRREAADLLAEDVVREALAEGEIDAYAPGELTELVLDPLTYKLTVPLVPTVDLGAYREYRLEPQAVEVDEELVEEALGKIREDNTIFESVERPATWGDGIALSLVARTGDGTMVLQGDDLHVVLEAGSTDPVPGFPEAIAGVSPGEERTFTLTLPPDFPQEEHAGQGAEFTVTVNDVYNQIIPALDDDLARAAGSFESLEEMEANIRERIRETLQIRQDREYTTQVVEAIVEQSEVDYPPDVLEQELDQVMGEVERSIASQNRLSMDDFLRMEGKTKEQYRESLAPRAASRATHALVLGEVVNLENLTVEENEIGAGIEQASSGWGSRSEMVRTSLESESGRRAMANRLLADKAVQRLVTIAKGELAEAVAGDVGADVEEAEAVVGDEETVAPDSIVADQVATVETAADGAAEPQEAGDLPAEDEAGPGAASEQDE